MSTEKLQVSSFVEQVELRSASSMIASGRYPLTDELQSALVKSVEVECGQIDQAVREREFARVLAAESAEALALNRADEARTALADALSTAKEHPAGGSWVKTVLWALCAAACFAAEFVLTWTALCFVLNVERYTLLGVLLGLAPPSGLAVLEVVLARLFEDPWQRVRGTAAGVRGVLVNMVMVLLLVALAAGNGLTIVHLAKAREEAGKAARALADLHASAPAEIDQIAIDRAVLSVSLLVSIDGALFLLLSLAEASRLRARIRVQREAEHSRSEFLRLDKELAAATSASGSAREDWKSVDEKARLTAERYRSECLYRIAEKNAGARLERPLEQLVDRSLRLQAMA